MARKGVARKTGPRASWRGMLRFGLVSFPVEAFNAHSPEGGGVAFHQLHAKCHNRIRYVNPEFDALVERYQATIPRKERMEIGTQLIRHFLDNVLALGLFYQAQPIFISHRVKNAALSKGSQTWNAYQWDIG